MCKSLALRRQIGPVFDVTLDCEDGSPMGGEAAHAHLVAKMADSALNQHDRAGSRIHPVTHPSFTDDASTM